MLLEIINYPDLRLRQVSEPVGKITPEIRELAANMLETMYHSKGVGLAAPQIGQNLRMLVMDAAINDEKRDPKVVINPQIELFGDKIVSEREGCLSVPLGYRADVPRFSHARVKFLDLDGNEIEEVFQDFAAIVVQHEFDHLEGKLFIDKLSHLRRTLYDSKVKKWLKCKNPE